MYLPCTVRRFIISNIKSNVFRRVSNSVVITVTDIVDDKQKYQENPLNPINKDVSEVIPHFPESFNLAAYINSSQTLQSLLHLKVDLSKIEKKPHIVNKILKLDFDNNVKKHILFLKEYIELDNIGEYITKNPLILCEPIEDLQVRVNYLQSKCFSTDQLRLIIRRNPFWLMFSTLRIDRRLGYFQQKFSLCGNEVRDLVMSQPKIITYNLHHINTNSFVIKEEMGFNDDEAKYLILKRPKIWMISQKSLLERFNYLHNIMKISHTTILHYPSLLLCRNFKIKQRHLFLKNMGRAQFDPNKENYVPISALYEDNDVEFCRNYGKCNIDDFNMFLKTL